jgi:citrate synthase
LRLHRPAAWRRTGASARHARRDKASDDIEGWIEKTLAASGRLLLDAIGVPRDAFTQVFAIARSAGWLANAVEQQWTGWMIRPASNYIGPRPAPSYRH